MIFKALYYSTIMLKSALCYFYFMNIDRQVRLKVKVDFEDVVPAVPERDFPFRHGEDTLAARLPIIGDDSSSLKNLARGLSKRGLIPSSAAQTISFIDALISGNEEGLLDYVGLSMNSGGL